DGKLAAYVPDQHDEHGEVVLIDRRQGLLRRSYAATLPPVAVSPTLQRLYLVGAGLIRAVSLTTGLPVATAGGEAPFAASSTGGLVAFVRAGRLVVARGDNLRALLTASIPGDLPPTALAWQGQTVLVGTARGITRIQLENCATQLR